MANTSPAAEQFRLTLVELLALMKLNLDSEEVFKGATPLIKESQRLAQQLGLPLPIQVEHQVGFMKDGTPEPYREVHLRHPRNALLTHTLLLDNFRPAKYLGPVHKGLRKSICNCLGVWIAALDGSLLASEVGPLVERKAESETEKRNNSDHSSPNNLHVTRMANLINDPKNFGKYKTDIARENTDWDETEIQNVLRQLRDEKYRHLIKKQKATERKSGKPL